MTTTKKKTTVGGKVTKTKGKKKDSDAYGDPLDKPTAPKGFTQLVGEREYFKFDTIGQTVQGIMLRVEKSEKKSYSDSLVIRREDDSEVWVGMSTGIKKQLEENKIPIDGSHEVHITLYDVVEIGKRKTFKKFALSVRKVG